MGLDPLPPASPISALTLTSETIRPQPKAPDAEQPGSTSEVAEQFTSIFMGMLVKEMWKTTSVDGEGPFGSGPGSNIYQGLAESAFADALAKNGMEPLTAEIERYIRRAQPGDTE